jgi:membrane associated rhomboid family serine protease
METASFNGTLAFGRMAIWMLFIANIAYQDRAGAVFAILCAALSYGAQSCYTQDYVKSAVFAHLGALVAGVVSGLCFVI